MNLLLKAPSKKITTSAISDNLSHAGMKSCISHHENMSSKYANLNVILTTNKQEHFSYPCSADSFEEYSITVHAGCQY